MKGHLGCTDKTADYSMLPDHFEALQLNVVDHMIAYCLEHNICVKKNNTDPATGGEMEKRGVVGTIMLDEEELMSGGIEKTKIPQRLAGDTD